MSHRVTLDKGYLSYITFTYGCVEQELGEHLSLAYKTGHKLKSIK